MEQRHQYHSCSPTKHASLGRSWGSGQVVVSVWSWQSDWAQIGLRAVDGDPRLGPGQDFHIVFAPQLMLVSSSSSCADIHVFCHVLGRLSSFKKHLLIQLDVCTGTFFI